MAKLGSHKRPAVVRVRTIEKAEEIVGLARERGWQVIVGVEPDKLVRAHKPEAKPRLPPKISGNDFCPCGSGNKFKKCCGATTTSLGT